MFQPIGGGELIIAVWGAIWLSVLGFGGYLALRLVRAFERRGGAGGELRELRDRVLQLEESIESIHDELKRVSDGQQFTSRLLNDRTKPDAARVDAQ